MHSWEERKAGQQMLRSGLLRIFSAMGSCRGLLHVVPGAMTLVRAWLLFVAFNIDLAQKNLEEVPVQPDFDAHKVSRVMAGSSLRAGVRTGCSVTAWVCLSTPTFQELWETQRPVIDGGN